MRVFPVYILCTCASDSTGDLVYASLVQEYWKYGKHLKIQHGIRAKDQLKTLLHKMTSPS